MLVASEFMKNLNKGFEGLNVWRLSVELTKEVYFLTKNFPKEELFGLTNQMRRSSISINSNIAEGSVKTSKIDFARFISMALGSSAELKAQIIISNEIGLIDDETKSKFVDKINVISRMLKSLENSLRKKPTTNFQQPTTNE